MTRSFVCEIPEGESGIWRVEKFTVDEKMDRIMQLSSFFNSGRMVPPGDYTRLMRGQTLVMSDTPDELRDDVHAVFTAQNSNRVLVHGLGLGCFVQRALAPHPRTGEPSRIEHIDVVEQSEDVLNLVGKYVGQDPRVHFHQGDAYTFKFPKGTTWDIAYHDIWDTLCEDNLELMAKLHRRYGRAVKWQDSWGKERLKYERERTKDAPWRR